MGIFDSIKPRVSKEEFHKMLSVLAEKGFTLIERNKVQEIFLGDLDESGIYDGIDVDEITRTIGWLRANKSKHNLSDKKLDILEAELKERI